MRKFLIFIFCISVFNLTTNLNCARWLRTFCFGDGASSTAREGAGASCVDKDGLEEEEHKESRSLCSSQKGNFQEKRKCQGSPPQQVVVEKEKTQPVVVNVYTPVTQTTVAGAEATAGAMASSLVDFQATLQSNAQALVQGLEGLYGRHRMRIWLTTLGLTAGSFYLYLVVKLRKISRLLSRQNAWCHWRSDKSLAELLEMDKDKLLDQLLFDIQTSCSTVKDVDDSSPPLRRFFDLIDKEQRMLLIYIWWANKIQFLHLSKLFFLVINWNLVANAESRLNRLAFLRGLVWDWISRKKVAESRFLPSDRPVASIPQA